MDVHRPLKSKLIATVVALCCVPLFAATPTTVFIKSGQSLSYGAGTGACDSSSNVQQGDNSVINGIVVDATNITQFPHAAWPWRAATCINSLEDPGYGLMNEHHAATGVSLGMIGASRGGATYALLEDGTIPFTLLKKSIEAAGVRIPIGSGPYVMGFYIVHGESDSAVGTPAATYSADLVEWQAGVESIVNRSTSWTGTVPLYLDQLSSWTDDLIGSLTTSTITDGMYDAWDGDPGRIVIIGPKYQLDYAADGVHLTPAAACRAGAYADKAMRYDWATRQTSGGESTWRPFHMIGCTRSAATVTCTFNVPVCPMVFDTTSITGVSATTKGFEYTCTSSPPTITNIANTSCTANVGTLTFTLSGTPDATCNTTETMAYAYTGTAGNGGGRTSGARGVMADSDAETATCGSASVSLKNFLIHTPPTAVN